MTGGGEKEQRKDEEKVEEAEERRGRGNEQAHGKHSSLDPVLAALTNPFPTFPRQASNTYTMPEEHVEFICVGAPFFLRQMTKEQFLSPWACAVRFLWVPSHHTANEC